MTPPADKPMVWKEQAEHAASELARLRQQRDESHDKCCQREASAVQRAELAEAEAAKLRAEREGMVLMPRQPTQAIINALHHSIWEGERQITRGCVEYALLEQAYSDMLAAYADFDKNP